MATDVINIDNQQQQPFEITERRFAALASTRKTIISFIRTQLVPGTDYGTIPGCGDKSTLFQPGVQKICGLMAVYPDDEVTISDLGNEHREYTVKTRLKRSNHDGTEITCATGSGSCSTLESKYRYRNAKRKCPNCGRDGLIKSKYDKWWCPKGDGCNANFALTDPAVMGQQVGKVENQDMADSYNTCLKMAVKRANMAATLNLSGGWSEHFDQADMEPDSAAPVEQANRQPLTVLQMREEYKSWDKRSQEVFQANMARFKDDGHSDDACVRQAYDIANTKV